MRDSSSTPRLDLILRTEWGVVDTLPDAQCRSDICQSSIGAFHDSRIGFSATPAEAVSATQHALGGRRYFMRP